VNTEARTESEGFELRSASFWDEDASQAEELYANEPYLFSNEVTLTGGYRTKVIPV
jgi:hypothetical protein